MRVKKWLVLFFLLPFALCNKSDDGLEWQGQLLALSSFSDNFNGVVRDANGAYWMKCTFGQAFNSGLNDCSGTGGGTTYGAKSLAFCSVDDLCVGADLVANDGPAFSACDTLDLGGFSDWRLPGRFELSGLASTFDRDTFLNVFPQTPDDKYFWSGNQDDGDSSDAFGVSFAESTYSQTASFQKKDSVLYVRCTR